MSRKLSKHEKECLIWYLSTHVAVALGAIVWVLMK